MRRPTDRWSQSSRSSAASGALTTPAPAAYRSLAAQPPAPPVADDHLCHPSDCPPAPFLFHGGLTCMRVLLLQAAPAANDFATLFNNLLNTGTGAAAAIIALGFLTAGGLYCLSSVNEHVAMRGRGMIAAAVVGGILMLGARNWAALVNAITPHGGG